MVFWLLIMLDPLHDYVSLTCASRTMWFMSAVKSMMKYDLIKVVAVLDAVHSLPSPWGPNSHANNDVSPPSSVRVFWKSKWITYREDGESERHPLIRQTCQLDPQGFAEARGNPHTLSSDVKKTLLLSSSLMMKVCVHVKAGAFRFFCHFLSLFLLPHVLSLFFCSAPVL